MSLGCRLPVLAQSWVLGDPRPASQACRPLLIPFRFILKLDAVPDLYWLILFIPELSHMRPIECRVIRDNKRKRTCCFVCLLGGREVVYFRVINQGRAIDGLGDTTSGVHRLQARDSQKPKWQGPKIILMETPRPSQRGDPIDSQKGGNTAQKHPS